MKVKMTSGTYGHHNKNGHLEIKDSKSAPFELPDEEAVRLINMGRAVESLPAAGQPDMMKAHLEPAQFADMSKKDLMKLAEEMGLSSSGSKSELIARITEAEVEVTGTEDEEGKESEDEDGTESDGMTEDGGEGPNLTPADPEA